MKRQPKKAKIIVKKAKTVGIINKINILLQKYQIALQLDKQDKKLLNTKRKVAPESQSGNS